MFLTPEIVQAHLRTDDSEAADLALKAAAAEQAAASYLDRAVFADQGALDVAMAAVPATLSAAKATYALAAAEAALIADLDLRLIEEAHAADVYTRSLFAASRTRRGLVADALVISAALLILGELWEHRGETEAGAVTTLPYGSRMLLDAYRAYA